LPSSVFPPPPPFFAAGEPVPHTSRHVKADAGPPARHPLPFFPLPEVQDTDTAAGYSVYVRTGPDGAVVRLDSRDDRSDATQPIREFLVDLSGEKEKMAALRLEWPPEVSTPKPVPVTMDRYCVSQALFFAPQRRKGAKRYVPLRGKAIAVLRSTSLFFFASFASLM